MSLANLNPRFRVVGQYFDGFAHDGEASKQLMNASRHLDSLCVIFGRLAVITAFALLAACGDTPPNPPTLQKVVESFAGSEAPPTSTNEIGPLDLYIDTSGSMKGFVTPAPSNFRRVLERLLEDTAGQYNFQRSLFSDKPVSANDFKISDFFNSGLYNAKDTPLSKLLLKIARQDNSDRLHLLISDLVQSESGTDQTEMISALQKLVERHFEIRLLGFRSAYKGRYAVENRSACTESGLDLDIGQTIPGEGRPFYVLAVTSNRALLDHLENAVLSKLGPREEFTPTDNPWPIDEVSWVVTQQRGPQLWALQHAAERLTARAGTPGFYSTFTVADNADTRKNGLLIRYIGKPTLRIDSPGKLELDAQRAVGLGGRSGSSQSVESKISFSDSGVLQVAYSLPVPGPSEWDVYRIRMHAGTGNLSVPRWVDGWSTNDDCLKSSENRTYRLELMARTLISTITEKATFNEHYIAIRRK